MPLIRSTPRLNSCLVPLALAACVLAPATAQGKTFVLPHVIESSGRTSNTPFTFDTTIFVTYSPGLAGTTAGAGATVDLYLYDDSGQPMRNSGTTVCNPCTYNLGSSDRKVSINVDDLITAGGLPFDNAVKLGFGVLVVGGSDPDGVNVQGSIVNAHSSAFDLSVFDFRPPGLHSENPCAGSERAFILPHVIEKSGKISNTQFTFDTTIFADYVGGLAGVPGGAGASVDLYLFDELGAPMGNNGQTVCAPCTFQLGPQARKRSIAIDDLITARGPFDNPVKLGFGILVVGGADPDGVALQGFVVNAHTSPFDVSVFGFEPEMIKAATRVSAPPLEAGSQVRALSVVPNPARATLAFTYELARPSTVDLSIFDPAGRKVATIVSGRGEAGAHSARWDGRDAGGARVAPGVYFGRLTGSDGSAVSKVVVLP